ncbi:MAG TPA: hypothetical protein VII72_09210 [Myxococcota bacterium]
MEPLHICVRRTLPWDDEEAVAAALDPAARPMVELWNATFNLRYPAFRSRLTRIARESWSRIEDAKLTPRAELPPGALVAPVDDDDWFSPEIASRLLAERHPSRQGFHWNRYIVEAPRRRRRWPWARSRRAADTSRYTCGSNNYAVRNLPALSAALGGHVVASRVFDANPGLVRHLDASLSIQSRSLASQSAFEMSGRRARKSTPGQPAPEPTRDVLLGMYRSHRGFYDHLRLPSEVAWAQPYVAAMAELMHELRLK